MIFFILLLLTRPIPSHHRAICRDGYNTVLRNDDRMRKGYNNSETGTKGGKTKEAGVCGKHPPLLAAY